MKNKYTNKEKREIKRKKQIEKVSEKARKLYKVNYFESQEYSDSKKDVIGGEE